MDIMTQKIITTSIAASLLKISPRRIRQLIGKGKIKAWKIGRDWVIDNISLAEVKVYGKRGRPKSSQKVLAKSR
jgi:excisionase family DNA binding protein